MILKLVLHLGEGGSLSQSAYFGFTFTLSNLSEFMPYYHSVMGDLGALSLEKPEPFYHRTGYDLSLRVS